MKKILLGFFLSKIAYAYDISLMLSPSELTALAQAQKYSHKQRTIHAENALRLDGIIYTGPNAWTIWINGRRFDPDNPLQFTNPIRILQVTPDSVKILWRPYPQQHYQICLKPSEVFSSPGD